ncbi:hypothetical protein I309_06479 [Cryptococcus deuterogattii LA55]|nr:hypothetical protein I309_06479 [Cryptococcus deuterogattii LA55]
MTYQPLQGKRSGEDTARVDASGKAGNVCLPPPAGEETTRREHVQIQKTSQRRMRIRLARSLIPQPKLVPAKIIPPRLFRTLNHLNKPAISLCTTF